MSTAEETAVQSCSVENLQKIKEGNKQGVFVYFSKEGCGGCDTMDGLLKECDPSGKIPIVEAGVDDAACMGIAEGLQVKYTPTVVYYKDGAEQARISADGTATPDDMRKRLREIVGAPS